MILTCPQCGAVQPAGTPEGECARCLIAGVLDMDADFLTTGDVPAPGGEIGPYVLVEPLGAGGMGTVWRARQKGAGRDVALKMIGQHALTPAAERRFRSEIEAAAGLAHPHIVPVYDVGEADGRLYFTMRLLTGGTLATLVRKDPPLPPAEAAALVCRIAGAVDYAHRRGVLHRDLKPANILLDDAGEPGVADFGLARRIDDGGDLTLSGEMIGTPQSMAPEQARGDHDAVTVATDVHGLGVILYELLTGQPPFRGGSLVEKLRSVIEDDPRPLRQWRPHIPADLETVCLKCLAKSPARRYAGAAALADDLTRFLHGEPVLARPATIVEKLRRAARRHRVTAALAVVLPLCGIAVLWQGWRHQHDLTIQRDEARTARDTAREAQSQAALDRDRLAENLYAADMRLAWQAWQDQAPLRARSLLARIAETSPARTATLEWRLLAAAAGDRETTIVRGFPDNPAALAFARDSGTLFIAGRGFLESLHVSTGRRQRLIPGPWDGGVPDDVASCQELISRWLPGQWPPGFEAPPSGDAAWRKACHVGSDDIVSGLSVSADGRRLLLAVEGGWKQVRDAATGKCEAILPCRSGSHQVLSDGSLICAGTNRDGRRHIALLDFTAGPPAALLPAEASLAAVSSDARTIITGNSPDLFLRAWRTPESLRRPAVPELCGAGELSSGDWFGELAIAPDGTWGAGILNRFRCVRLYDLSGDGTENAVRPLRDITGFHDGANSIAISPGSRWIAIACGDHSLRIRPRDEAGPAPLQSEWWGHTAPVDAVTFLDADERVATAANDGTVRLWNVGVMPDDRRLPAPGAGENRQAFLPSPDGRWLAGTQWRGEVRVTDLSSGRSLTLLPAGSPLGWTEAGELIIAVSEARDAGGEIRGPWRVEWWPFTADGPASGPSGRIPLADSGGSVAQWRLNPDATRLAVSFSSPKPQIGIWDLRTGNLEGSDPAPDRLQNLAWSPDSRLVAGSVFGSALITGRSDNGDILYAKNDPAPVRWLEFSPDGRLLAAANYRESRIVLFDAVTGEETGELAGHTRVVGQIAFSPDSRTLASISQDRTVRLWHVPTLRETAILSYSAVSERVAIGPGGRFVVFQEGDGRCRVWHAKPPP